jgi:PAS domain S-box-containing protein
LVEELDEPEKSILSEQGIISILIIPIYAGQDFWGFIGFDDCLEAREWDENDIDLLRMIADGIGEFISRKKSEDELRESEERYKALHNATFGGILIHDKGKIIDCNQGLSDMTGYSKEELLVNNSFNLITEESKPIVMEKLASGSEEPYEIMGRRKDGTEYPIRVQARNIPYKGKQVRVTEFRDITEEKESEKALKESEERFKALHQGSFGGIFIHIDDTIIECNQGLSEITGYSQDELIGKKGITLAAERCKSKIQHVIATHYEEPFEVIGIRKDGTEYPLKVQAKTIPYKGEIVRVVEFRDITEQKKSENELRESEQRFKALHNASFGGITIHDKGLILDCNLGISEITGYSVDELIGMNGLLLIAESSREMVMDNILAGYEEPYEAIGCRKDGTEYPVRLEARNIPYKGKMVRVVEFRDITERKESEEARQKSENKYHALFENNMNSIVITEMIEDENGYPIDYVFLEVNPVFEKETGLKAKDIIGKRATEVYQGIEKRENTFLDLHRNVALTGIPHSAEIYDNENDHYLKVTAFSIEKNIVVGVVQDITERKVAEQERKENERKLNAMIENIADVIAITDKDGINKYKSPNIERLMGWKPEEIVNTSVFDNIHPDEKEKMQMIFASLLNMPKTAVTSNARYLCKDGYYKWIEFTATNLLDEPAIEGILLNYHDINERKEAEDLLLESERKFRNYLESAPYGIFILDEYGNYLEVNKTACNLTGYTEDELTHMSISNLIAPETLIIAGQSFDELKTRGYTSTELLLRHKDGNVSWVRRDGAKLSDNRFILFTSDITEKKKAEHSLIEAKMLAEHNNRIKSEFLANMSHELRTPLTAVIGFSDILQEGIAGELEEKQLGYVEHINKSGKHLLEIINDILDLSKIEAGKMELECEDFHVSELINETLESMKLISGKKNIKIKLINNVNNGTIHADKVKFQQILYNLLSNAIKFTPDNGEVSVSIEKTQKGIQVSVKDTGIGIVSEMQDEIFSAFSQVDASSKRRYGGTGLGLALVKQFVEMHNGKVWLESEEGKGSTFSFTIEDQKRDE